MSPRSGLQRGPGDDSDELLLLGDDEELIEEVQARTCSKSHTRTREYVTAWRYHI